MAAYAALVSLMNNIDQIQNHPCLSTSFDEKQIESLSEKVDFFLDFMERDNSHGGSKEVEDLETQIASAVHEAEDVIESRIVDQILARSTEIIPDMDLSDLKCLSDLQNIIAGMDSIKEKAMKVEEERRFINDEKPTYSMPAAASSTPLTAGKTTMVGFDGYFTTLLEKLTGGPLDRQMIPIIGMGGIGKTTLARNVYERLLKEPLFDVHAWVTVSPEYNVREILLKILLEIHSCLRESSGKMDEKTEVQLGVQLHKTLSRRRYLIILDDIWSIDALEKIQHLLPDNHNRSRIIVTTRISNVANHFGSSALVVESLDDQKSWNLFCHKAFALEGCPLELQEIGKKIVKKCRGLPLSIVVIGGLLGKSSRMKKDWEYVEKHLNFIVNSAEENRCLNIISLSYNHLPTCLKPCFLYMGIFPEDHEICVSQLIKLWVAEGFLKSNKDQSQEDIAKGYIKDLVDRNLILVCGLGSNGNFKTCKIHDLLRDFCIRVVEKEKFLCVMRVLDTPRDINGERRIIIHGSTTEEYYYPQVFHALESSSLARSLICQSPTLLSPNSRLLRVLTEAYSDSLDATFGQVNLRLLAYGSIRAPIGWMYTYKLPLSISLLWNVQTLIIDKGIDQVVAPSEIWKMLQLRHVQFRKICLPDPPPSHKEDDFILQNLQTLGTVSDFRCSKEVCRRMPNIRKLRMFYDDFSGEGGTSFRYGLHSVCYFNRLESLNYCFYTVPNRDDLLQNLRFPSSLKRLTLECCELHWNDLTIMGLLPHLEVLKLKYQSVRGPKWNPVEGEFQSLKFLEIESCYIIYWNADSSHFPVLEKLVLRKLRKLDEIPSSIGEIPTLEGICVTECSISAAVSAIRILEEQESLDLQVRVEFWDKTELEEFQEKVRLEGFTTRNFQTVGM